MRASALEYALIHNAFQVILCFCCQIVFAVKRTAVLCRGDIRFLLHPFQHVHAVAVYQLGESHVLVWRTQQTVGECSHVATHLLHDVFRLDALRSATFGVLCNELSEADGFLIGHVHHVHQHRLLHGLHIFGCQPEVCGVFCQILFVYSRLFWLASPHLAKCRAAVVALYHLATCVHGGCACVGRYRRGDFFRPYVGCNLSSRHHTCLIIAFFRLRLVDEVHRVALSVDMAWLQL